MNQSSETEDMIGDKANAGMTLSGAEMVVQSLADIGVKYVFGYPGGAVLDIYDAIYHQDQFKHILVRHEQAAVHAADGYARSTGDVGTVLVTSGPGATNTITGIATAYMDSIPLVVISGQVPTSLIGSDAFQESDMVGCSRPVVKHSFLCTRTEDVPCTIAKAYHIAKSGRPGPVVVDLPKDVMNPEFKYPYTKPEVERLRSYNPTLRGNPRQIKKAIQTLANAKRPMFYTGGGLVIANANEKFLQMAEQFKAPVTSTLMGLGGFPGDHPQFLGMLGMHGTLEANKGMAKADVIIAFGARFDDRVTNNVEKFSPDATIIHIDIDPASISKNINADIPIVGSLDVVIAQFLELMEQENFKVNDDVMKKWWQQLDEWKATECLTYEKNDKEIKPQQVVEAIYKATNGDAYVASDVGQHQMFGALYYPFKKPRQWLNSGGLGTMGFGLPAAIGAQFAHPDATVVCISGDGSIQMNIQELATCMQYDLPLKIFTINNASLGMVRQWQDMIYGGRHSHSYMDSVPDFAKLAEAYGHVGLEVDDPAKLDETIEKAIAMKDKLVFVDIKVAQSEHVYPMQLKGGAMDEMWLSKGVRG